MIIKIKTSDIVVDNRKHSLKGVLSDTNDIDEVYRELCKHFSRNLTEMRGLTKMPKGFTIKGLTSLCDKLDLLIVIDTAQNFFFVKYQDKDVLAIEGPGLVSDAEIIEEVVEEEVNYNPNLVDDTPELGGGTPDDLLTMKAGGEPKTPEGSAALVSDPEVPHDPESEEEDDDLPF